MKIHKPKSIKEAIGDLQVFLESDLYTKLRPIEMVNKKKYCREDFLKTEEEFLKYLNDHFKILNKHIIKLIGKKEFKKEQSQKQRLTRIYTGKEILCKECKTKKFRSMGNRKEYGEIVVHKKNCPRMKKLVKIRPAEVVRNV